MKVFKKKETSCCNGAYNAENMQEALQKQTKGARIKILGSGCAKCASLGKNTQEALRDNNMVEVIDHVIDFAEIASYGVMSTPALVIDGNVVAYGSVLSKQEILEILKKVGF